MNTPPDLPGLSASGWTVRERGALLALALLLLGLFVLRAETRRQDGARIPLAADVVVIHVAGLRADALPSASLAADLGLDPDRVLSWSQAFSPSGDARRSLLSVLRGDLVLNLDHAPGPGSLAARFGGAGWQTYFVGEGVVPPRAAEEFSHRVDLPSLAAVPGAVDEVVASATTSPLFLVIHLGSPGDTLHTTTTESTQLRASYNQRMQRVRGTLARIGQALTPRLGPRIVAVVGGSGLELGGHPGAPNRPWDDHLRVPMVMGMQQGQGLPWGQHSTLVQTSDLAPTLLDLMDLRSSDEHASDSSDVSARSLEPLIHGWATPPVHQRLFFADVGHAAVRTAEWKLISPVNAPWKLQTESTMLFAMSEDPEERSDLASERLLGPVGSDLLNRLRLQLSRPATLGTRGGP
jgi:hypothetical protein